MNLDSIYEINSINELTLKKLNILYIEDIAKYDDSANNIITLSTKTDILTKEILVMAHTVTRGLF